MTASQSYTAYVPTTPLPPDPPRPMNNWMHEAAVHARLRVFPGSALGEHLYHELDWASRHQWAPNGPAVQLAREIYRLHEAGFYLPRPTSETGAV